MKVIIREAAYDDLDRIYAWIAKDRPRSADAVVDRILDNITPNGSATSTDGTCRKGGRHT